MKNSSPDMKKAVGIWDIEGPSAAECSDDLEKTQLADLPQF